MAELSPQARKALGAAQTSASILSNNQAYDEAIFAAGIAFGATARQRQDAEIARGFNCGSCGMDGKVARAIEETPHAS